MFICIYIYWIVDLIIYIFSVVNIKYRMYGTKSKETTKWFPNRDNK